MWRERKEKKQLRRLLPLGMAVFLCLSVPALADEKAAFRILLTNDDGIRAEGLTALYREIQTLGGKVTVVAPTENQSGVSHAIRYREPFRVEPVLSRVEGEVEAEQGGLFGYAVNGTPADAVLLGVKVLMADHPPDLVISGINHGENVGLVAHLSGTVGGAMEATTLGIPAIAVSLGRAQEPVLNSVEGMDYAYAARVARQVALLVRKHGLPAGTCLNVNVPALPEDQVRGITIVRQGNWRGEIRHERRMDLFHRPYYWRGFALAAPPEGGDTDVGAFYRGYVTVTPIKLDWTDYEQLSELEKWGLGTR